MKFFTIFKYNIIKYAYNLLIKKAIKLNTLNMA